MVNTLRTSKNSIKWINQIVVSLLFKGQICCMTHTLQLRDAEEQTIEGVR